MSVATKAPAAGPTAPSDAHRRTSRRGLLLPAVLVLGLAGTWIVLALEQSAIVYLPDEQLYQHLARAIGDGQGFSWRGQTVSLRAALYVYLIAPAWMVANGDTAYQLAKLETALFCCSVALPVWLLARTMLPRRLALWAVVLTLSGSWMASAGCLLTESIAIPLSAGALASMVHGLRRGRTFWVWMAFGFAILAASARMQVIVLVPALAMTLVVDAARFGAEWGNRLLRFRRAASAIAGMVVLGGILVAVAGHAALGDYSGVLSFRPNVFAALRGAGSEILLLAAACAFLPLLLLAVLIPRRRAWRDEDVGPLLAVLVPATMLLALENGVYMAADGLWPIQRYMLPVAPVLLVFLLVAARRPGLVTARTLASMAIGTLVLLATPKAPEPDEQRAIAMTTARVRDVLPGAGVGLASFLVALTLCLGGAVAYRRGTAAGRARRISLTLALGTVVVLLAQTISGWATLVRASRVFRSDLPSDAAWVDHHARGRVAVLEVITNSPEFALLDFFNQDITRFYAYRRPIPGPLLPGATCDWTVTALTGTLRFERGCPPQGDEFFINDPAAHMVFYDEVHSVENRKIGRLVRIHGAPRLMSLIVAPCDRPTNYLPTKQEIVMPCRPQIEGHFWLSDPGILRVRFKGSPETVHHVTVGSVRRRIPAGKVTTLDVRLGLGASNLTIDLDWARRSSEDPSLLGIDLRQNRHVRSLL